MTSTPGLSRPGNSPVAPAVRSPLYFVNAPVDVAVIGGLSIAAFLFLRLQPASSAAFYVTLAVYLSWVCNWPHFSATIYRLYHSRENIRQYPMTALATPWLIGAGVVGSMLSPAMVAPYFVKFFLIWSPYHFSGQSLGISLVYARRAGIRIEKWERFALAAFIYAAFLVQTARAEAGLGPRTYFGVMYPILGIPEWVPVAIQIWMYAACAGLVLLLARWCFRHRRMVPPIVLLPAAAHYVWFVAGAGTPAFIELVPFFHGMQYLLIAWSMQLKEKYDREQRTPSSRYVVSESLRWGIANLIGGTTLFFLLPKLLAQTGVGITLATAVIYAGIQIHHFFVDGVIWKLKNKNVSSPLMVKVPDLWTRPGAAELQRA